jgi:hypothetical protein
MSRLAWQGGLLFAFIPIVLALYLQQPLGPGLSLCLGVALMLGHRFVAAPWMAAHARERCLWCGRRIAAAGVELEIAASGSRWALRACDGAHRDRIARFLTFVARRRLPIAAGIFLPLGVLLGGSLLAAAGHPVIPHAWNALQFRTLVAITVVGTSIGYLSVREADPSLGCPFPLHNLFLLGIRNTLWVFRVVGACWLVLGGMTLAGTRS